MPKPFNGVINLDVRDSVADWGPYLAEDGPGGRAERPDRPLRRHRAGGVGALRRRDQHADDAAPGRRRADLLPVAHDRALLADPLVLPHRPQPPSERLCLSIAEGATGLPGLQRAHPAGERGAWPRCCARTGWNTFWVGKNHNVPIDEWAMGATKRNWPLARGFDRFYGFIGGETNQWYPDLVEDNHFVDQPYLPEEGYHLSKDLADKAHQLHPRLQAVAPRQAVVHCGSARAPTTRPHHAPQEYIDKYKGKFDDGYEAYREWVLPRMVEQGIMPEGTELTPLNPMPDGHVTRPASVRAVGLAHRRREAAVLPDGRGLRRLLRVHRRPGRPDRRLPGGVRPARQHASSSTAPTTARRARAARTARSTRTSSSTAIPTTSTRT